MPKLMVHMYVCCCTFHDKQPKTASRWQSFSSFRPMALQTPEYLSYLWGRTQTDFIFTFSPLFLLALDWCLTVCNHFVGLVVSFSISLMSRFSLAFLGRCDFGRLALLHTSPGFLGCSLFTCVGRQYAPNVSSQINIISVAGQTLENPRILTSLLAVPGIPAG